MKTILSFLFLAFFSYGSANACDCTNESPFLSVTGNSKLIALVKVTKHKNLVEMYRTRTPLSMEVEIIEVLKGKETRKTIEIFGNNGMLCRPYVLQFREGTEWVLALEQGNEDGHQKKSDYYISNCGTYWLSAQNKSIKGIIAEGHTAEKPGMMSFGQFKQLLLKKKG